VPPGVNPTPRHLFNALDIEIASELKPSAKLQAETASFPQGLTNDACGAFAIANGKDVPGQ
jgi:hypothetical protein